MPAATKIYCMDLTVIPQSIFDVKVLLHVNTSGFGVQIACFTGPHQSAVVQDTPGTSKKKQEIAKLSQAGFLIRARAFPGTLFSRYNGSRVSYFTLSISLAFSSACFLSGVLYCCIPIFCCHRYIARAYSAHQNGWEAMIVWVAAVLLAAVMQVDEDKMSAVAAVWLISRIM